MSQVTVQEIIDRSQQFAPQFLREGNDPTGFQLGDRTAPVKRLLVTLDVRPEVVDYAIAQHVDMIWAHHPMIFHAPHNLDLADPQNRMYAKLLTHGISVFAAHTNLDKAVGGMNDWLAAAIGLHDVQPFAQSNDDPLEKLVVFTPQTNAESMRQALAQAGAGQIGDYSGASFSHDGEGRFTPEQGAHPVIGTLAKPTVVAETRIEVIFPHSRRDKVLQAMLAIHPYEEPAYDIFQEAYPAAHIGIGRIGELSSPLTVKALALHIKDVFSLQGLRVVANDLSRSVQRIAVVGGDGGKFFHQAQAAGAQAFVTGDVYYHTGHDMLAADLPVIDPGHHIESIVIPQMSTMLAQWSAENDWQLTVIPSPLSTDPFTFL
ncbi:MAG: Nif3-like dinuclear metal center hexameric protein [Schleiferilactobacillus harbinensis]|jgi:dinuclear metal center YbgI/SA1388 family protein|nr:Nif3-like dinuclear metal center hexameric protein [Schleiferilactobacillus harbinensis]MCI1912080.1 Nif3-like dinuclear metal center hexameric protein [Schleiferilactobacillus harbinensis]